MVIPNIRRLSMDINNFELFIDETILARGRGYYNALKVTSLEYHDDNMWIANVEGSDDYTVAIILSEDNDITNSRCDCPYDWSEHCKHQVAVFYAIRAAIESGEIPEKSVEKKNLKMILKNLSKRTLVSIVLDFIDRDERFHDEIYLRYGILRYAENESAASTDNTFKRRKVIENQIKKQVFDKTDHVLQMMDWQSGMNQAIDYIERHLSNEIDYLVASRYMNCSVWEFQRLFSFMMKVPLSEYIRQRRLTLAAQDIQNSKDKIIDIALRYGYDSPASFSRAFNQLHGTTPKSARNSGVTLKIFPRLDCQFTQKEFNVMTYRLEEKAEFQVIGTTKCFSEESITSGSRGRFWHYWNKNKMHQKFSVKYGKGEAHHLCVSARTDKTDEFYYTIGFLYNGAENTDDFNVISIPSGIYMVFVIPDAYKNDISKFMAHCIAEYIPAAGYELAGVDIAYFPIKKQSEAWFLLK